MLEQQAKEGLTGAKESVKEAAISTKEGITEAAKKVVGK
jgi:hypothetical protein